MRTITTALSLLLLFAARSGGESFHNGGMGNCDGCHSRARKTGPQSAAIFPSSTTAGAIPASPYMLNGSDPGSTCLVCHAAPIGVKEPTAQYVATGSADLSSPGAPPRQLTPGGDFGWLKKSYHWSKGGGTDTLKDQESPGERHGHSVVAHDFGYLQDTGNLKAPGGAYPAESLSCISCHDPHGTYRRTGSGTIVTSGPPIAASGSYKDSPDPDADHAVGTFRMLAGIGYQPKSLRGDYAFRADPPAAVTPRTYNRAEADSDTRVAYGRGMSEWCQNCHTTSHKDGGHPAGNGAKFSDAAVKIYNSYVGSGDQKGKVAMAYNSLVPFEMGTDDYALLKRTANSDGSVREGAKGGRPNVICLSCHRAHASAWDNMARWNMKSEIIKFEGRYPGTDNHSPPEYAQGRTSQEVLWAYYGRPASAFSDYQRGLCSKCHAKD